MGPSGQKELGDKEVFALAEREKNYTSEEELKDGQKGTILTQKAEPKAGYVLESHEVSRDLHW